MRIFRGFSYQSGIFGLLALFTGLVWVWLIRLSFLFISPLQDFSYDFGFYFDAAARPHPLSWLAFFPSLNPGYDNIIFFLARAAGIHPQMILLGTYAFSITLLGIGLYALFAQSSRRAGLWAVILYACSIVQIQAYSMFLWKTMAALGLSIWAMVFFTRKRYWPFAILLAGVFAMHRTTAAAAAVSIAAYAIMDAAFQKKYIRAAAWLLGTAVVIAAGVFYLNHSLWWQSLALTGRSAVQEGLFFGGQNIWLLALPMLVLGAPCAACTLYYRRSSVSLAIVLATGMWMLLQLPFYRRMFIYFDLGLILLAAEWLGRLQLKRVILISIYSAIFAAGSAYAWSFARGLEPLISTGDANEIKTFAPASGFILAVSANDAPWLLTYSPNQNLGAPGMFNDPHSYGEWKYFWTSTNSAEQAKFLSAYSRPLYLYQRSYQVLDRLSPCLKPLSPNFSEYLCN